MPDRAENKSNKGRMPVAFSLIFILGTLGLFFLFPCLYLVFGHSHPVGADIGETLLKLLMIIGFFVLPISILLAIYAKKVQKSYRVMVVIFPFIYIASGIITLLISHFRY
jgi:ABC-type transport system involved in multi-copper enzyme maturation permease subunit